LRRTLRGNPARVRVAMRRLSVRVQRLILIHGGTGQARVSDARCNDSSAASTCALCDLQTAEWQRLPRGLGVSVETVYRDTASGAALTVCRSLPSVVAQTFRSFELLLDTDALQGCSGSVHALLEAVRRSARVRGLDVL
jgi:hypothetical protein